MRAPATDIHSSLERILVIAYGGFHSGKEYPDDLFFWQDTHILLTKPWPAYSRPLMDVIVGYQTTL